MLLLNIGPWPRLLKAWEKRKLVKYMRRRKKNQKARLMGCHEFLLWHALGVTIPHMKSFLLQPQSITSAVCYKCKRNGESKAKTVHGSRIHDTQLPGV